jgi:hypothetical protein
VHTSLLQTRRAVDAALRIGMIAPHTSMRPSTRSLRNSDRNLSDRLRSSDMGPYS